MSTELNVDIRDHPRKLEAWANGSSLEVLQMAKAKCEYALEALEKMGADRFYVKRFLRIVEDAILDKLMGT